MHAGSNQTVISGRLELTWLALSKRDSVRVETHVSGIAMHMLAATRFRKGTQTAGPTSSTPYSSHVQRDGWALGCGCVGKGTGRPSSSPDGRPANHRPALLARVGGMHCAGDVWELAPSLQSYQCPLTRVDVPPLDEDPWFPRMPALPCPALQHLLHLS